MIGPMFFGIDIQAEVAANMPASDLPNYILTKTPKAGRTAGRPTAGLIAGTPVVYTLWGARTNYTLDDALPTQQVMQGDLKFVLIAKPLADAGVEISIDDTITEGAKIYSVISARLDAASAVWICQCRG